MKVHELIEKLKQSNPDSDVLISYTDIQGKYQRNDIHSTFDSGENFYITPLSHILHLINH